MPDSVYVIKDIVGTSPTSWEDAARQAIETAAKTLQDLRIAEVVKKDVTLENGKVTGYRVRLNISMKYHPKVLDIFYMDYEVAPIVDIDS